MRSPGLKSRHRYGPVPTGRKFAGASRERLPRYGSNTWRGMIMLTPQKAAIQNGVVARSGHGGTHQPPADRLERPDVCAAAPSRRYIPTSARGPLPEYSPKRRSPGTTDTITARACARSVAIAAPAITDSSMAPQLQAQRSQAQAHQGVTFSLNS